MPAAQNVHWFELAERPLGHSRHPTALDPEYWPSGHFWHGSLFTLNRPGLQVWHRLLNLSVAVSAWPWVDVPAGHKSHSAGSVRPGVLENWPMGHLPTHPTAPPTPVAFDSHPGGQSTHCDAEEAPVSEL